VNPRGPVSVGVVGAGVISHEYLSNLTSFPDLEVVFVADLDEARAAQRASEHGVPAAGSVQQLLEQPDIEIVVNLTIPAAHAEVTRAALESGKHVWVEKPLATNRREGYELLEESKRRGLLLAGAPDTFLGTGHQAALRALRNGEVGTPLTAFGCMQVPGPEAWHHNPEFFYNTGAGPLFDMGPYYLTLLVQVFGPLSHVTARSSTSRQVRTINSGPREGQQFQVNVPTHVAGCADFSNGRSAQFIFSFDSPFQRTGLLEIMGTDGALAMPDPNGFNDPHVLWAVDGGPENDAPIDPVPGPGRGLGVLELARALRAGAPARASGELAFHVLDALVAIEQAARDRSRVAIDSTVEMAPTLPTGWSPEAATL
jgi:predicted dehydrogenase